ncbi:DUF6266 family protein [Pedobacter sp. PWIIR3]
MAKLKSGLLGPVSGKIGPVIGGVWKGVPYLKEAKEHPTQKPRSAAQLAALEKFKFVNDWLIPFHPFLTIGFTNLAVHKTEIAAGLSAIYNKVFSGSFPDLQIAYDEMVISSGNLPMVKNPAVSFVSSDQLHFTWDKNAVKGTQYIDQMLVALYNREEQFCDGFIGGANRATEFHTFKLNPDSVGKPLDVYLATFSVDRKKISNTQYLGQINPL